MKSKVRDEFKALERHVDSEVTVIIVNYAGEKHYSGILKGVIPFNYIGFSFDNKRIPGSIPFIGNRLGIREISDSDGNILYSNPHLLTFNERPYLPKRNEEDNDTVNQMRMKKFGKGYKLSLVDRVKSN